jgi:hypothetical protein
MKRIMLASLLALSLGATAHAADKEWTFLLYLNGNNNLDSYGKLNINQMEAVGSSDDVNMVVQWASLANGDTRRLFIKKDNDATNVTSPVVQNLGNADMGDARTLEDFIKWGITTYPAKHYFVAVWDHGSGWRAIHDARLTGKPIQITDISWDDNTGHSITTKQLGGVMSDVAKWLGRKIDIYGSDACLMGMAEVAGEMKDSVAYFVGSQDLEPGEGWPYTQFLTPLVAKPSMSARELSSTLTREYAKSYDGGSNGSQNVTMASYDLDRYNAVKDAISKLTAEVNRMPAAARTKVYAAANAAQAFEYSDYVDLGDFLKKITAQQIREIDSKVIDAANVALSQFVVLSKNTGTFAAATGASIWIPKDKNTLDNYLATYKTLVWDADTRWSNALSQLIK